MSTKDMQRRSFLKAGLLGVAGLGTACRARGQEKPAPDLDVEMKEADPPRIKRYAELGRSGIKVSDVSLGMAREASVLHYAVECGVNFFDTAEAYYDGEHEAAFGKGFAGLRDKVVLVTKHGFDLRKKVARQEVLDRFDASLKRLATDHVDVAMMHGVDDPATFAHEEILGAYEALKKAGKYRVLGFSTHDPAKICPPAFESKLFGAMLVPYNSVQFPERSPLLAKAKELGIGVIAMKTLAGREQDNVPQLQGQRGTYAQAAIKWALADPAVTSAVVSARTFEHVDEYVRASGGELSPKEQAALQTYREHAGRRYCRVGCHECEASCPRGVAVADVLRYGMYFENYGLEKHAVQQYARLEEGRRASACAGCSAPCERACPHGLAVAERLVRNDRLLRA